MQLITLVNGEVSDTAVELLSKNSEWKGKNQNPATPNTMRTVMAGLIKQKLLTGHAYSRSDVVEELKDYADRGLFRPVAADRR